MLSCRIGGRLVLYCSVVTFIVLRWCPWSFSTVIFFADEPLTIDPLGEGGGKPGATSGAVNFKNIKFAYPTRPNMQVNFL